MEDKNKAIEWMKDFFIEQKCHPRRGRNDPEMTKDEVHDAIKKVKTLFSERERDS